MNVSRTEKQQDAQVGENANRMYTPEEDQEILAHWWDKDARPDLCRRLGRTKAAVAQRFYAIVKARGIDPKQYRKEMREKARKQGSTGAESKGVSIQKEWSNQEEMKLWRLVKSGMQLEEISAELGRPLAQCIEKLSELKDRNRAQLESSSGVQGERFFQDAESAEPPTTFGSQRDLEMDMSSLFGREHAGSVGPHTDSPGPQEDSSRQEPGTSSTDLDNSNSGAAKVRDTGSEPGADDDILETLKEFPRKMRDMDGRLQQLESEYQMLRENMELVLEELASGIRKTSGFLQNRKEEFTTFQRLKEENSRLREELEDMRRQMEEEKRELRKTYQEVDFWLGEFMKLRKIEKVASLSDLIPKLKYSYDRFGVLLNVARE